MRTSAGEYFEVARLRRIRWSCAAEKTTLSRRSLLRITWQHPIRQDECDRIFFPCVFQQKNLRCLFACTIGNNRQQFGWLWRKRNYYKCGWIARERRAWKTYSSSSLWYILQYDLYYKMKLSRLENCELCAQKISDVSKASSEYSVIRQCYDKPADVTEAFGQYSEKQKWVN